MNKDSSFIFRETGCLSEQQLIDYLDGKLNEEETHAIEVHIADCDFCSDALEGLSAIENKREISLIVRQVHNQLRHELQSHQSKTKKVKMYSWLAALVFIILLILLIAFMATYFSMKKHDHAPHPATPHPVALQTRY